MNDCVLLYIHLSITIPLWAYVNPAYIGLGFKIKL